MTLLATAGAFLFALALVLFVIEPILTGRSALVDVEDHGEDAAFRKHAALRALRDVEYDYQTGKLDESDYRRLKREMVAEAAEVLGTEDGEPAGDPLEAEIRDVRLRIERGEACPRCGADRAIEARFCAVCGTPLAAESLT
ncbi:MAG: zinc ribbon domain-containing protein [Gemmatimonadetes bacterium]|nr:zinc ribbon domain-containing protein [Gemmatimonadota bacterium]